MKPHHATAIRRVLASIDQANAFLRFEELERLVGTRILTRGAARPSERIDQLLAVAGSKARGTPVDIAPQEYFELAGLWHTTIDLGWAMAWVLYDEVAERGLAGFSRPSAAPSEWFFVLSPHPRRGAA
jgi:hypothetical protein